jgi:hypothetical protein
LGKVVKPSGQAMFGYRRIKSIHQILSLFIVPKVVLGAICRMVATSLELAG